MTRQETISREEAVRIISRISGGSVSYAEDLYDSFFPKPVVPQYVADWYEENKDYFEVSLFQCIGEVVKCYNRGSSSKFEDWLISMDVDALTTLVNMHQFGYKVEKETKYRVKLKEVDENNRYLNRNIESTMEFLFSLKKENKKYKTKFTRKELEDAGFGWVFDCEGIEIEDVKEVDDGND